MFVSYNTDGAVPSDITVKKHAPRTGTLIYTIYIYYKVFSVVVNRRDAIFADCTRIGVVFLQYGELFWIKKVLLLFFGACAILKK